MSTLPFNLAPSTWRILGLSVAAGYVTLGLAILAGPRKTAADLLGLPPPSVPPTKVVDVPDAAVQKADSTLKHALPLIGARDVSIGIALVALDQKNLPKAMGILTISGLCLCVADAVSVWRHRGKGKGAVIGAGATIWAVIGWGLLHIERW